jgi:hypothetical protein
MSRNVSGPQHDFAWCDELASWRYPEAWDMLMFGLRLGADPRIVVTTTPKPIDLLIGPGENNRRLGLLRDPGATGGVYADVPAATADTGASSAKFPGTPNPEPRRLQRRCAVLRASAPPSRPPAAPR